ncbi:hypothetical protein L1987_74544 [Smallanthus sonchifolius]|uniref:Uncharacterized protein n=1 Tax=Smallanthus sonchifolius TaxID=185202 RepID=A0ACB9A3M4_9ASTR|nr:hypothetical protein L1987_74544 [Smallanthus sonchifolius]
MDPWKMLNSSSISSPCIFSSQDRQWLRINDMENTKNFEAQLMQYNIRNIFKDALKRKVEALDRHVSKRVRVDSERNSMRQHQASLETRISKPVPIYAEFTFTAVATETFEEEADEKIKGKMSVTKEEDDEKTCSVIHEHVPTDPHNIILGTNMPLGMADEIS